ncbi:MAG: hypothetical protein GF364_08800 [Candidatus Lokiarchaeota archaeon]|nr:hypothetical protein [Candidatus Lokiarchaeota archaeon]
MEIQTLLKYSKSLTGLVTSLNGKAVEKRGKPRTGLISENKAFNRVFHRETDEIRFQGKKDFESSASSNFATPARIKSRTAFYGLLIISYWLIL